MIDTVLNYNLEQYKKQEKFIDCKCSVCRKIFKRKKSELKISLERSPYIFCGQKCFHNKRKHNIIIKCLFCNKEIYRTISSLSNKNFCNHSCSAKYFNSTNPKRQSKPKYPKIILIGQRKNILTKKLKHSNHKEIQRNCKICDKLFHSRLAKTCSLQCRNIAFVKAGQKSALSQAEKRRSKNEILFFNLCIETFLNVKNNLPIFNGWDADIILLNEKIAILWNGKWHYEQITKKHSVKQVQNRDSIKMKEITNAGYTPYVIKDMGKYNPAFVKTEFEKFCKLVAGQGV